jgi:hypothetical protein
VSIVHIGQVTETLKPAPVMVYSIVSVLAGQWNSWFTDADDYELVTSTGSSHSSTFKAQVNVATLPGDDLVADLTDEAIAYPRQVIALTVQVFSRNTDTSCERPDGTRFPPSSGRQRRSAGSPRRMFCDKVSPSKWDCGTLRDD